MRAQYARSGVLKGLTNDLKGGWGNTFYKSELDVYNTDGKSYGVPVDMGAVGFWYNKALFAKAGISSTHATWCDFLADVKKLKAAGIIPIALGTNNSNYSSPLTRFQCSPSSLTFQLP